MLRLGNGMSTFSLSIYILMILSGQVNAIIRRWVPNTDYDNPANWKAGKLPCKNDNIRFPRETGTVYIQTNVSFHEVVLPVNGELVLANYGSFVLDVKSGPSDIDCPGTNMEFNGTSLSSWYDERNWCEVADSEGACLREVRPRLHTERIPCQTDEVIMPDDTGYRVDLASGVDIYMGTLSFRGKDYSTGQFRTYLRSQRGRKEFIRDSGSSATNINIKGQLCSDSTGCPCGNDGHILEQKVCDLLANKCTVPTCNSPILPEGHCCQICGTIMLLEYGAGFKYRSFEDIVHNVVPRSLRQSVQVIVSRLQTDQVQVVVQDMDGTNQVQSVVDTIKEKIGPDAMGNSRYRILGVQVTSSNGDFAGNPNPQHQLGSSGMKSPGSIASLVIAIIAVIAIVLVAMYCLIDKKRSNTNSPGTPRIHLPDMPWPFRRFGRPDNIELGPSVAFKDTISAFINTEDGVTVRGFDNPTYNHNPVGNGQPGEDSGNNNTAPISTIDVSEPTFIKFGQAAGFSNPLYSNQPIVENLSYLDSSVRLNPMFSTEGLENDSEI